MTVYAVCPDCAHVEPRPDHALYDWFACENCGDSSPQPYTDPDEAATASYYAQHTMDLATIPDSPVPYGRR